ncbi:MULTISPECIES: response regulator transcription factor [Acidobacteriaceae]|uniref:response regulator transcription factor n=1 Tax=Acidobacteriaceae TaxID=204434 RepID=UPI00131C3340|nr:MULTISPECIES: response regulator transcription factor [Acidobacteriaceae]MDW5264275.1 response regulator transcription factor [Edaphobacter sp.]
MNPLLMIDDDIELCTLLTERLAEEGFVLHAVHNGRDGLERAIGGGHSLVILDVMLPRMGGMEVLRELRMHSSVPVLMLTARGDDIDRIIGLEVGADDYLPKPFNPRELVARIKAILRRLDDRRAGRDSCTAGDITIDIALREAWVAGKSVQLTTVEFALLEALVRNAGRALTRDYLTDAALGRKLGAFDRSIDVHISNLRKKLDIYGDVERIKTIRGSGYLLAPRSSGEEL